MSPSIPSSPVDIAYGRRTSSRRVRKVVRIGQYWTDGDHRVWRVISVWRADRLVLLQSPGWKALHRVTFEQLGRHYELRSEEGECR